jgi:triphosphoribosyl-dephospho-CoA synthetase
VTSMEEARTVLARLERIEALDRADSEPDVLLGELRELVREVEVWAKRERDPRAEAAAQLLAEHAIVSV